jgi:hypothetical protein
MALNMGLNAVGGDPRVSMDAANANETEFISPKHRLHHDPSVTFEEYHYYALKTREIQDTEARSNTQKKGILQILFPPKSTKIDISTDSPSSGGDGEKVSGETPTTDENGRILISDREWTNASRAVRTASWAACFYLITTDILGPFGVGYEYIFTNLFRLSLTSQLCNWDAWLGPWYCTFHGLWFDGWVVSHHLLQDCRLF